MVFSMCNMLLLGETPAPTAYKQPTDFDHNTPHGSAFSFGIAREAYAKVYVKENPVADKSIPGPGTYSIEPKIGNEASKFTMKGRTSNHCKFTDLNSCLVMLTTTRLNPGPGAYDPKTSINANGSYYIAKIPNSKAPTFSLPSLPRFQHNKLDTRPGPGAYSLKIGITDPGSTFISTFKSPKVRTFYHSDRKTIDIPKGSNSKVLRLFITFL